MKSIKLLIIFVLYSCSLSAQKTANEYAAIDKKALAIPDSQTLTTQAIANYVNANFATNTEKARAIFIWTASTLEYDVANMYAINFHEKQEEKINKALITHKGICENYAAVFTDVCKKCGLKSFVVPGYTKQNGTASYLPHGWSATMIDSEWYFFDPTWGSGYIVDNKFVRKINNNFFKVAPAVFIKSHMPFDPMWECLFYPVTNQEFYEGKTEINKSKPYFSFRDSIAVYEKQSETEQWAAASRRIQQNGIKNGLIYDWLANIRQAMDISKETDRVNVHNEKVGVYNSAVIDYNDGIRDLNDFINYRNQQFKPMKADPEIQSMVDSADHKITRAKNKLDGIQTDDANLSTMRASLLKSVAEAMKVSDDQKEFLKKYLSKGKLGRMTMFSKYSIFNRQ